MLMPFTSSRHLSLFICVFITSCSHTTWRTDERAALRQPLDVEYIERLISVPLDPETPAGRTFDLYYFVSKPTNGRLGEKTILFCSGGPGQIVHPDTATNTFADFLRNNGYTVVYFHLRGSGFSQVPGSTKYDKFLKSQYAVEDIERVRQDFLGDKPWDAIISWSYGTVLAQQYAASRYGHNLRRLVLIAPLSEHKDDFNADDHKIRRNTLEQIYMLDHFRAVDPKVRRKIIDDIFGPEPQTNGSGSPATVDRDRAGGGIVKQIEDAFGSEQYLIEEYCELKKQGELHKIGLDKYRLNFFRMLRELRMSGSRSNAQTIRIGTGIALELNSSLETVLGEREPEEYCTTQLSQSAERLLYVMRWNDGLPSRIRSYLKAKINKFRSRLAHILNHTPTRWNPAQENFRHTIPTLVLKGGADAVTAGEQAENFYKKALRGPKAFLDFPGIGHEFQLPIVAINAPFLSGTARFYSTLVPPGVHRLIARVDEQSVERRVTLVTPEELKSHIEVVNREIQESNRITATLLNKSTEPFLGGARAWTIDGHLFMADLQLTSGPIEANQTGVATGTISEPTVHQHMEIVPPGDLSVELVSASYSRDQNTPGRPFISNRVSLIIKNKGPRPITSESARNWRIQNPFYTGNLIFERPGNIGVGATGIWAGAITNAKALNAIEVIPAEDLEPGLIVTSAGLDPYNENQVAAVITNTGKDSVVAAGRDWIVRSPFYTASVRFEPGLLLGHETKTLSEKIRNFVIKPAVNFEVQAPELANGVVNTKVEAIPFQNTLSVMVFNGLTTPTVVSPGTWVITNPAFTAPVIIEQSQGIPGKTAAALTGKITKVEFTPSGADTGRLTLIPPTNFNLEFIIGSECIESQNRVSVLVRNTSSEPIRIPDTDWIYITKDGNGTCQGTKVNTRNCLLYTFISMNFTDFINPKSNKIFETIQKEFNNEVTICCNSGSGEVCPCN